MQSVSSWGMKEGAWRYSRKVLKAPGLVLHFGRSSLILEIRVLAGGGESVGSAVVAGRRSGSRRDDRPDGSISLSMAGIRRERRRGGGAAVVVKVSSMEGTDRGIGGDGMPTSRLECWVGLETQSNPVGAA